MPNEQEITVTNHPPIEVPEGEWCAELSDKSSYCNRIWGGKKYYCSIYLKDDDHMEPLEMVKGGTFKQELTFLEKCDPCKAECEKAKHTCSNSQCVIDPEGKTVCGVCHKPICETCGGSEELPRFQEEVPGRHFEQGTNVRPCSDCKPKPLYDHSGAEEMI